MKKSILSLGNILNKERQKKINGGRLEIGQDDGCHWASQCLNQWGRCTTTMSCNCVNPSENHFSCNEN